MKARMSFMSTASGLQLSTMPSRYMRLLMMGNMPRSNTMPESIPRRMVSIIFLVRLTCATVESVKAASDIYAPIAGEVVAVNQAAVDAPESVNQDAYAAWLFKLKPDNAADLDGLLDAAAYAKVAAED